MRRIPEITDVRFSVYFSRTTMRSPAAPGRPSTVSKDSMYPCSRRIRASSFLSFEDGISTVSCAAMIPLRIRVRKSAMGSVMLMPRRLPARLGHAGDVALVRELAQADAAEPELLVHRARPAALAAARVSASLVLRRPRGADDLGGLGHVVGSLLFLRPRRPGRSRTR